MNQFDIRALLFGVYARFIPVDKMVFYGHWKALPFVSLLMLNIALTLFQFCRGLCCSLFNYPFRIILIEFYATCVPNIALVAETILFP